MSIIFSSHIGIDLKTASKTFGQKFATGSSVTGNGDEIMIQGDVKDDLIDILTEKWPEVGSFGFLNCLLFCVEHFIKEKLQDVYIHAICINAHN